MRTQYETDDKTFSADAYRVKGYGGIAWRVYGWEIEQVYEESEMDCYTCGGSGEVDEEETCPTCGGYKTVTVQDEEPTARRTGEVVCVMMGDDRRFTFDPEDISPLEREEYCGECGQIGCGHDGLDRDEQE